MSLEFESRTKLRPDRQGLARVLKGTLSTIATASKQCQTLARLGESIHSSEIFGLPGWGKIAYLVTCPAWITFGLRGAMRTLKVLIPHRVACFAAFLAVATTRTMTARTGFCIVAGSAL